MTDDRNGDVSFEEWENSYSMRDMLTVVFKRRKLIILFAASVVVVVAAVVLLMPPNYVVTATLLVNKARAEVPLAPTESPQPVTTLSEQDLNSEVEILKSRALIEDVVATLGVDELKPQGDHALGRAVGSLRSSVRSALGRRQLSPVEQMVVRLNRRLEISAVRRSNVIRVSYRTTDPEWATRFVQILTERYIERRVERYQSPQVVSFFEQQMRDAENRLIHAEKSLEDFSIAAGVTITKGPQGTDSLSAQKAVVLQRLARSQNDIGDAEADVQEQSQKVAMLRASLADEPERLPSASRMNKDAVPEAIKQQLTELALERDALLQDFKPDSRYVRDIETQIELAKERLKSLESDTAAIYGTETNPIYQSLKAELLRAEADFEGTRARLDSLRSQIAHYKSELDNLNDKAFELESLRREAQAAEEEYLLYRKKHEEARISAAMDQQRLINVTIAQPAQRPLESEGRGLKTTMLLGILVGVVGGLGLAFVTEFYLDHTFTTGHEIERRLGIPHIASIPEGS